MLSEPDKWLKELQLFGTGKSLPVIFYPEMDVTVISCFGTKANDRRTPTVFNGIADVIRPDLYHPRRITSGSGPCLRQVDMGAVFTDAAVQVARNILNNRVHIEGSHLGRDSLF